MKEYLGFGGRHARFVAERAQLRARMIPRVERVKLQAGENPCSGALQLALAARALRDDPSLGAAVVNSLGAGGNQIVAVFTAP